MSFWLDGPRFEPPDARPSYPSVPAADGRGQKYLGSLKFWPSSDEPTSFPSIFTRDPFALPGKSTEDAPETARG